MQTADTFNLEKWKDVQRKTFTKWLNNKLEEYQLPTITDLFDDLSNGVTLLSLTLKMLNIDAKYNKIPHIKIQKMENFEILFDILRQEDIQIINIHTDDIVNKNKKLTLGLVWTIIIRLSLKNLGTDDSEIKKAVLRWCRAATADYDNVDIKNFSTSWKSGLAFNAILHKFGTKEIGNYDDLSLNTPEKNLEKAFNIAKDVYNIPKLLETDDLVNTHRPDENSVFTYVSEYYNKFKDHKLDTANKNRSFLASSEFLNKMVNGYEEKAKEFIKKSNELKNEHTELIKKIQELSVNLQNYDSKHNDHSMQFIELNALFSNINIVLKHNKLPKYENLEYSPEQLKNLTIIKKELSTEKNELNNSTDNLLEVDLLVKSNDILKELKKVEYNYKEHLDFLKELSDTEKFKIIAEERKKIIVEIENDGTEQQKKIDNALKIINKFDCDKSGCVSQTDYINCCNLLGINPKSKNEIISLKEIEDEFNKQLSVDYDFIKIKKNIKFERNTSEEENYNL